MNRLIFVLGLVILVSGCTGQGTPEGGGGPVAESDLPTVSGWQMTEVEIEPAEGFSANRGIYQKASAVIILSVYEGEHYNSLRNLILSKAYDIIEEPTKEGGGIIGENEVYIISDDTSYVFYFGVDEALGYVIHGERPEHIEEFLNGIFDNVFIDI